MRKHFVRVLLVLAASLLLASVVHAEPKFDYGADFRLRQEIWDNVVTLDTISLTTSGADRNFLRLRTRLWGKADFTNDFGAYLRLTNEAKWYGLGPYRQFKNNPDKDAFDQDEIIFDNLYADAKNLFGAVDLRIGRQDFIGTYGEGFLIMDGTPGDGSRSFYFNAAKANVKVSKDFNFDLTYITDPKTDIYMPSIHPAVTPFPGNAFQFDSNKKVLTASNEQAFVAYGRGKVENLTIEPYYMYKTEQPFPGDIDPHKLKLNTIGARALYSFNSWKFGGEFAHQWGEYDGGKDRRGNGGYLFVSNSYANASWKPEWELRYVYLSGDDPNTKDKVETWDPLFSRNPYWNELIIYTLIPETGKYGGSIPGYWTNMEIIKATVKLNFTPATNLALAYQYLWAPEVSGVTGGAAAMFGTGKSRGHLPTAILSHKFTKNIDGMLQFEYFAPGSFYANAADNAIFFRWQLNVKL
jgi:hypothetical protein